MYRSPSDTVQVLQREGQELDIHLEGAEQAPDRDNDVDAGRACSSSRLPKKKTTTHGFEDACRATVDHRC